MKLDMCWKCWAILIVFFLGMIAVALAAAAGRTEPVVAHRLGIGSAVLMLAAVIADRSHPRTHK